MRTTAPLVKATLKSAFQAVPALNGIQVSYGDPGKLVRRETIFLGSTEDQAVVDPVGFRAGRKRREEDYDLRLHIEVSGTPGGPEASERRAADLGQAIEEYLADHHDLGGIVPGLLWARVSGWSLRTEETTDGAWSVLTYTVSIKARLL